MTIPELVRPVIAGHIRIARELSGLTPEEVSARTDGKRKLSASYIRRLEKGLNSPTVETLVRLCSAYGTTLSKFVSSMPLDEALGGKRRNGK